MRRLIAALVTVAACGTAACGGSEHAARPHTAPVRTDDGAAVVARTRVATRIVDLAIRSPALGTTARVRLLTLEGWKAGPGVHDWPYWQRELHRSLPLLLGAIRSTR
jgi:diacylglycerol O-acyltransferase/trehalose O-mycolyltransferase